jgi:hypothetical protein
MNTHRFLTSQKILLKIAIPAVLLSLVALLAPCNAFAKSAQSTPLSAKKDVRRIVFSRDVSLGKLYLVQSAEFGFINETNSFASAKGTVEVTVPPGYELVLNAGGELIRHPELLDVIPADALDGLKIVALNLGEEEVPSVTNLVLAHAGRLTGLKRIFVSRSDVTDAGLVHLAKLRNLKTLDISLTPAEGKFLKSLQDLKNVEYLSVSESEMKPENLQYLKRWTKLRDFYARRVQLTNGSLQFLTQCQNLQGLDLGQNERIDDNSIKIINTFRHLLWIDLDQTKITPGGLEQLKPSSNATRILVSDRILTRQEAQRLEKKLKPIIITVKSNHSVPDRDLTRILSPLK